MMKNLMNKKGVASIEDLREATMDCEARMIACQMTPDLFEHSPGDMIVGVEIGGAATHMGAASKFAVNLFI